MAKGQDSRIPVAGGKGKNRRLGFSFDVGSSMLDVQV
jgi:hypothetical protein